MESHALGRFRPYAGQTAEGIDQPKKQGLLGHV